MSDDDGLLLFLLTASLVLGTTLLRRWGGPKRLAYRNDPVAISLTAAAEEGGSFAWTELWTRISVTAVVLGCSIYMILSNHYSADQQKWAYGVVGIVLGYWLKG